MSKSFVQNCYLYLYILLRTMTVKPKEFFEYGMANYYILQKQENYIRQNTILIIERQKGVDNCLDRGPKCSVPINCSCRELSKLSLTLFLIFCQPFHNPT